MTLFHEVLIAVLMVAGTFLIVVTGLGLLRFPDVYCRMHAAGKAGTLGISTLILAAVVFFAGTESSVTFRGLLAIYFQFLTTPAATHLLSHACYVLDYPRAEVTVIDELRTHLQPPQDATFGHE